MFKHQAPLASQIKRFLTLLLVRQPLLDYHEREQAKIKHRKMINSIQKNQNQLSIPTTQ